MNLAISKNVLIPRPETECLVEAAVSLLPEKSSSGLFFKPKRILELGTGSGAVILALASCRPDNFFFASDCLTKALEVAKKNAIRHNLAKKINFFSGDWFKPIKYNLNLFDIIVSNPPYIQTQNIRRLQPEIFKYEPLLALDGQKDGLSPIKHIIRSGHVYLKQQGHLLLEIGSDQKNQVQNIIDKCGNYEDVSFIKDCSGHPRVVQMKKRS